jgi:hypothetical protein
MTRLGVVGLICCILTASVALAKPGVVKTKNGQTYEGEVEEKPDGVVVTIKGIQTRIAQRDVSSVNYPEDYDKQLAEKRAKLDKTDVKGRIALARDAFNNKRYIPARDILEEALTVDPNNTEANELRDTTMAQIRLERSRQQAPTTDPRFSERANAATTPTTGPAEATDHRFLKPVDINTIRQYELQDSETDVPLRFERDVKRRYATKLSHRPIDEFLSLTAMQQAMEILKNGAPEMRNDVKIMRDPQAMMIYRRTIQPYVLPNCATSQCHGGNNAGSLVLSNPADSDQATYTNFFILQAYTRKAGGGSGVFGKGEMKIVDRTQPGKSLILQYSIPTDIAEFDHPEVPGYRPALRGPEDLKYRQILSWIHDSLNPSLDQPNYGINFHVPGASTRSTTAPATQPATTTATTESTTTKPTMRITPPPPRRR